GRLEAASGPIRPLGASLEAPFTGRRCIAYEYDVKPGGEGASDYAGVAMVPSVIDSTRGPARLLGWPMLDQFLPAQPHAIDERRGDAYLASTAFEDVGLGKLLS